MRVGGDVLGRGRAVRTGRAVPEGPCALEAATSAHTPVETGSPVRTAGPRGGDAGLRGSQAARPRRLRAKREPVPPKTSLMVSYLQAQNSVPAFTEP